MARPHKKYIKSKGAKQGRDKGKTKPLTQKSGGHGRKDLRFIQRGKEMVEQHRKQRLLESKVCANDASEMEYQQLMEIAGDVDEVEEGTDNALDELVSTFTATEPTTTPILLKSKRQKVAQDEIEAAQKASKIVKTKDLEQKDLSDIVDIFTLHLNYELTSEHMDNLLESTPKATKFTKQWSSFGTLKVELTLSSNEEIDTKLASAETDRRSHEFYKPFYVTTTNDLQALGIKATLLKHLQVPLTPLQSEAFTVCNNYQDLYYAHCGLAQIKELRTIYCLHALNHMLKIRSLVIHNSAKIAAATKNSKNAGFIVPDAYRDQGLVRPKVLIVLPFRSAAFDVINTLVELLYGDNKESKKNGTVANYSRFVEEYTGNELYFRSTNPKPEDYRQTFSGNTDDNFRLGLALTKKSIKLYTDFYVSDIILASPLGLRTLIGAPGSKERDYDFLNSIELLVLDQAQVLLAQNWENLLYVLDHLHLQPQSLRHADLQRVRPWCLNGQSRFYRQTLLLTSHDLPEFRALFNKKCSNYRGRVQVSNPVESGDVCNVVVPVSQVFNYVEVSNLESSFDVRFEYFIREILPRFKAPSHAHCMVYVPSYFDYVRLRNYFKAETISCVQICEYTKDEKIARARDMFFHSGAHFMLYSERSHFFRRTRIKGIRHLIMYQPCLWPNFYSEMVNMMHSANQNANDGLADSMSITVLYTKHDLLQLSAILGSKMAAQLIRSGKPAHAFKVE